jgi:hypothetical protein
MQYVSYTISDQTAGSILKRYGIPPAPARKRAITWGEFIRTHMDVAALARRRTALLVCCPTDEHALQPHSRRGGQTRWQPL